MPALGVGRLVSDLRRGHDPSAKAGIPPHLTLMFPYVPPARLTAAVVSELEGLLGRTATFGYSLAAVREFDQGVVYLEPEPSFPFVRLTRQIGERFGLLPFGGAFGEHPVPHLTVAMPESRATLRQIADLLEPELPKSLRAEEAWLMVGTNAVGWRMIRAMPFRGAP